MRTAATTRRRGFTLAELVVVVLIIGMISSMAIPRISRGATTASGTALAGDLNIVRRALLRYAAEHRNTFPGPDAAGTVSQLTQYSNASGGTLASRTGGFVYGPYLLRIPPCPVGHNPGSSKIAIDNVNSPPQHKPASGAGWVYNPNTGEFYPNATTAQVAKTFDSQRAADLMLIPP